jgi:hypothetical protein
VYPDKEVELVRIEDEERDPQELIMISVRQVLFKHQVNHLPFWQSLFRMMTVVGKDIIPMGKDARITRALPLHGQAPLPHT